MYGPKLQQSRGPCAELCLNDWDQVRWSHPPPSPPQLRPLASWTTSRCLLEWVRPLQQFRGLWGHPYFPHTHLDSRGSGGFGPRPRRPRGGTGLPQGSAPQAQLHFRGLGQTRNNASPFETFFRDARRVAGVPGRTQAGNSGSSQDLVAPGPHMLLSSRSVSPNPDTGARSNPSQRAH